MQERPVRPIIFAFIVVGLTASGFAQEHWPQWRGPTQNGVSMAKDLPTTWSESENIVWKAELPSWSAGTPVIWGDRIFVTSPGKADANATAAQEEETRPSGRRRRGEGRNPGGQDLLLLAISKKDGSVLWKQELDTGNRLYRKQNNTSPSPVTDGNHVWVVTGTGTVTAFDMSGGKMWQMNLQKEYGEFGLNWGYASSPALYNNLLIIQVLHGYKNDNPSYIVAFEATTGKVKWRQERKTDAVAESPDAYTTPALLQHNGQTQVVITGADYITGHNPETGKEIWRASGLNPEKRGNYRICASPIAIDGIVYAPTRKKPLLALRAGGSGDVTDNIVWKWQGPASTDVPTPACDGKYFYMVDDRGMAICLDAKTGDVLWGPEHTAQGNVSASPILADGKIYITNEQAVTTVLAAGPEFRSLATNELDGSYTLASPVAVGSQLFVRTASYLYCIGAGTD